jgi:ubiquinone/menaquinone biosynthesis C-methylase UbiE
MPRLRTYLLVPGHVAALPFPDAAFDLVVSTPAIAPADRKAGVA